MYRFNTSNHRNDPDPTKDFTPDYEKILCACALSVGRILGSVCHDHPLHPDAISLGEESKKFYQVILYFFSSVPVDNLTNQTFRQFTVLHGLLGPTPRAEGRI
jgi:hypothetical protein